VYHVIGDADKKGAHPQMCNLAIDVVGKVKAVGCGKFLSAKDGDASAAHQAWLWTAKP
jgi:hypothetical protein